jgi:hypothetical protein
MKQALEQKISEAKEPPFLQRMVKSLFGALLIVEVLLGITPFKSEWINLALVAFGGYLVSARLLEGFVKLLVEIIKQLPTLIKSRDT